MNESAVAQFMRDNGVQVREIALQKPKWDKTHYSDYRPSVAEAEKSPVAKSLRDLLPSLGVCSGRNAQTAIAQAVKDVTELRKQLDVIMPVLVAVAKQQAKDNPTKAQRAQAEEIGRSLTTAIKSAYGALDAIGVKSLDKRLKAAEHAVRNAGLTWTEEVSKLAVAIHEAK